MPVVPSYCAVGKLFRDRPIYFIPKYQRAYAWDKEEIEDFNNDLENCFLKRESGGNYKHFFGGLVSVKHSVPGAAGQHRYEIIDGQQRMATFVIFAACIIEVYNELKLEAEESRDGDNYKLICGRIELLIARFVEFKLEKNLVLTTSEVLVLSKADKHFFRNLINRLPTTPERDSHGKLKYAYETILNKLRSFIDCSALCDKMLVLKLCENILDEDFEILHLETDKKQDAYSLFQVINDRGTNLTEGDLLRVKTLELLEGYENEQDSVEILWDGMLSDQPNTTEKFLRWIYASYKGERAGKSTLFDDMLKEFYPQAACTSLGSSDANMVLNTTENLKNEILTCRKLIDGEWPFAHQSPISSWHRNKLALLVKELGFTLCMPILLAATKLDHRKFFDIVQGLEKFMFRYKIMCNQHVTSVSKVFHEEVLEIRTQTNSYNIADLLNKLRHLLDTKTTDTVVNSYLDGLQYSPGGGNKPLKYLLITIEYYLSWFNRGASGTPTCMDTNRIFEFTDTTIEHVYPRRAQGSTSNSSLEAYKNDLGNLTILDPTQNQTGENDDFNTKKPIYAASSVLMNRELSGKQNWDFQAIIDRRDKLKAIVRVIFKV